MIKNRLLICLCLLSISLVNAQTSSWDIVQEMGRGINLGNTLTAPIEGNWAPVVYEQYFIDVANEGFSNVRIHIDFVDDRTSGATNVWSTDADTAGDCNGTITD